MNLMFRMNLLSLTNFINISLIKNSVNLLIFIKYFDGYLIFNVGFNEYGFNLD
jgi:hypothetical protein